MKRETFTYESIDEKLMAFKETGSREVLPSLLFILGIAIIVLLLLLMI